MDSTVNLSFRYSQVDIVRAVRAHFASRLNLKLDIVLDLLLAVIGVYWLRLPSWQWLGMVSLGVSVAFALVLVAAFTFIPILFYRREPKFRDDYSLMFSPEGIHFRTAHIDSQLHWSLYSRALVDAHSYVLYYGSRSFTVIPRRFFESAEQQKTFDELLAGHVSRIDRKDR